ncbi:hypothetical protein M8J77_007442 [Diaphorina citri]|nr:hypothetical protein M8J77_007442 [Diaphorina citri]
MRSQPFCKNLPAPVGSECTPHNRFAIEIATDDARLPLFCNRHGQVLEIFNEVIYRDIWRDITTIQYEVYKFGHDETISSPYVVEVDV